MQEEMLLVQQAPAAKSAPILKRNIRTVVARIPRGCYAAFTSFLGLNYKSTHMYESLLINLPNLTWKTLHAPRRSLAKVRARSFWGSSHAMWISEYRLTWSS